ncbi:glycosyltransferase [Sphingomonas sp. LB3N6]|uniref:glycosyltransferase n=1 Tax=Sphingomonas fucosidasi TaxID=3096164 RepID=UPI002FCA47C3
MVSAFYNRGPAVAESVGSLLSQSHEDLEVIIVDDGSRDDTVAELHALDDPRLRIITRENRGFVASMNEAIAASTGEIVAVHGSGDISLPNRIARQAACLSENANIGVLGCWVETDATGSGDPWLYRPPTGLPFHETLLKRNLFTHGEVMFRRSLYDKVGGYRDFFRFAQDRDLWLRMSRLCDYAIVPEVLYRRFKPEGGVSSDPGKMLLQSYLADFAVQCARVVDAGGKDPIERHGHLAPFLREPSEMLARKLAWHGAHRMVQGDIEQGWAIVKRANREGSARQLRMITALAALHLNPVLWRSVGRPMLERRMKQFQQ